MHTVDIHLSFDFSGPGELEDILQRVMATGPRTMDVDDVKSPECSTGQCWLPDVA